MKVILDKPEGIIIDFVSTAVKVGFIEKGLYAYVRRHGLEVMQKSWGNREFRDLAANVRRQVKRDIRDRKDLKEIPPVAEKTSPIEEQQSSLYCNIIWYMDHKIETAAHYKLKFHIYNDGYQKQKIVTQVYSDVARNLQKWKDQSIKRFIYSNSWEKSQQTLIKKTNHGDLFPFIDTFFDTQSIGESSSPDSFKKLAGKIGISPDKLIYLTKGVHEGRAAKEAGLRSILVISHNHQLKKYTTGELDAFPRIRSFDELLWKGEDSSGAPTSEYKPDCSEAPPPTGSKMTEADAALEERAADERQPKEL